MCNIHLIKKKLVAYQEAEVLSYPFLAFVNKDLNLNFLIQNKKSSRFKKISYKQFFSLYPSKFISNVKFPLTVYGFSLVNELKGLSITNFKFIIFKYKSIFLTALNKKNMLSFFYYNETLLNIIVILNSYNKINYYYNAILNK
jgi:hypothetical protein